MCFLFERLLIFVIYHYFDNSLVTLGLLIPKLERGNTVLLLLVLLLLCHAQATPPGF